MTLSEVFEGLWLIVREKALAFWREDNAPKRTNRGRGEESLLLVPIPAARSKWVFFIFFAALVCVGLKAFWLQCGISTDFLKKQGNISEILIIYSIVNASACSFVAPLLKYSLILLSYNCF